MSKLQNVEKELHEKWPNVKTKVIQADFCGNGNIDFYNKICDQTKDIDLSMLILNAGIMNTGTLDKRTAQSQQDMIDTNVYHPVMLAKLLLPRLIARRRAALIINSSAVSQNPCAGNCTYAATKAFVTNFTQGLTYELKHTNVDFQALNPSGTATNLVQHWGLKFVGTPCEKVI